MIQERYFGWTILRSHDKDGGNSDLVDVTYSAEEVIHDNPLKKDQSKIATVKFLMDYATTVQKAVLQDNTVNHEGFISVMARIPGIHMAADGDPTSKSIEEQRKYYSKLLKNNDNTTDDDTMAGDAIAGGAIAGDATADNDATAGNSESEELEPNVNMEDKVVKVQPVLGGFHEMFFMYKNIGSMFHETRLEAIISLWRPSLGQANWILAPSDPNQGEAEYEILHHSTYHAVLQAHIAYCPSPHGSA